MKQTSSLLFCLLLALPAVQARADEVPADTREANTVYAELINQGVIVAPGQAVKLPEPVIPDGLTAAQQRERIAAATGRSASSFILSSSSNPKYTVEAIKNAEGQQVGTEIHFYFVAFGDLPTITDAGLLGKLVEIEAGDRALPREIKALTPEQHADRQLAETARPGYEDWYYGLTVPVMNLVQLSGIGFATRTRNEESILAAINYLTKFEKDKEFPSVWRPIENKSGIRSVSETRHPYESLGGYLKATQLADEKDSVFVECHFVFSQPSDWFQGRDPLSSKLGIGIRNNVRDFALDLKRAVLNKRAGN